LDAQSDLQNLFNNGGPPGADTDALLHAVEHGAQTLDCFDGFLPKLYATAGFVATGRIKFVDAYAPTGWNFARDGRPDVVFMAYQGGVARRCASVSGRSRSMRRPMANITPTSILPKLPAERRSWLESLSADDQDFIGQLINKFGQELVLGAKRFERLKTDYEHAKNF